METKVITNKWFECKIKYTKMMEDGMNKSVTELVVLPADDFGDAYEKCLTYISGYFMEDAEVTDMKIAKYREIVSEKDKVVTPITMSTWSSLPLMNVHRRKRNRLVVFLCNPIP